MTAAPSPRFGRRGFRLTGHKEEGEWPAYSNRWGYYRLMKAIPGYVREQSNRNYRAKLRLMDAFGPFCAFCGETDKVVLQFDHKIMIRRDRDGMKRATYSQFVARMRRGEESPFNIQIVCANCHARKNHMERTTGQCRPLRENGYAR